MGTSKVDDRFRAVARCLGYDVTDIEVGGYRGPAFVPRPQHRSTAGLAQAFNGSGVVPCLDSVGTKVVVRINRGSRGIRS